MGGHGHAMGTPRLGLGAKPGKEMQWEKRHRLHNMHVAYGRTQAAHRRAQGNAQARARQRTGSGKAEDTGRARQCTCDAPNPGVR